MYLDYDKRELYEEKVYGLKNLSAYAKRETKDLYEIAKRLGDSNIECVYYPMELIEYELERIGRVINRHSKLYPYYQLLQSEINHKYTGFGNYFMKYVVRLEAALNIEILGENYDAADVAFDDIYMKVVNNKYNDPYKLISIRNNVDKLRKVVPSSIYMVDPDEGAKTMKLNRTGYQIERY